MHPAQINRTTDDEIRALTASDTVNVVLSDPRTPNKEAVWCEVLGMLKDTLLVDLNMPSENLTGISKLSMQALNLSGIKQDPLPRFAVKHYHILCCKKKAWVFNDLPRGPALVDCVERSWSESSICHV